MPTPLSSLSLLKEGYVITRSRGERAFRTAFGLPSVAVEKLLRKARAIAATYRTLRYWSVRELLQCLNFLASPPATWDEIAARWRVARNTFQKYLKQTLFLIRRALPKVCKRLLNHTATFFADYAVAKQVNFRDRFIGRKNSVTFILDTMKCPVSEPDSQSWQYLAGTSKFALKYEIGCSIADPKCVWMSGPWKGAASDSAIAKESGVLGLILPGEYGLADKAYRNIPQLITPVSGHRHALPDADNRHNYLVYQSRQSVERLIRRIRNGKWNKHVWRFSHELHAECMSVQVRLTNLALSFEPLG